MLTGFDQSERVFDKFFFEKDDIDSDGIISKLEARAILEGQPDLNDKLFEDFFRSIDVDEDGSIDIEEYTNEYVSQCHGLSGAFKAFLNYH